MINVPEYMESMTQSHGLYVARILAIQDLRSQGYSLREIGRALDISHERVRQLARVQLSWEPPSIPA